jgi:hypothetical protein
MLGCAADIASEQVRRDAKNEDCYYQAAMLTPDPPRVLQEIITFASGLART